MATRSKARPRKTTKASKRTPVARKAAPRAAPKPVRRKAPAKRKSASRVSASRSKTATSVRKGRTSVPRSTKRSAPTGLRATKLRATKLRATKAKAASPRRASMESPAAARDLRMPSADAPQRDRRSERASTRDYASPTLHEDASLHAMTRRERVHAAKVERDAAFADRPAEPEQRVHPVMTGKDLGARRSRATARRMDAIQPRHSARFAGLREHHDEAED